MYARNSSTKRDKKRMVMAESRILRRCEVVEGRKRRREKKRVK